MTENFILPSSELVGVTINLQTGNDPFKVHRLLDESKKKRVLITSNDTNPVHIPGSISPYLIPKNLRLNLSDHTTQEHSLICESGSELAKSLNVTASVSASYAGVSVSSSAQYDYESSVKSAHMYGIYSLDSRSYSVYRDGHKLERDDFDKELIEAAEKLPPWDKIADILKVYTELVTHPGVTHEKQNYEHVSGGK